MKNKMGVILVITLVMMISFSILAVAESGRGKSGLSDDSSDDDSSDDSSDDSMEDSNDHEETEIEIESEDEPGKQKIKIKSKSDQRTTEVRSEVEVEIEDERGEQKLKIKSNGDSKTLGVTPEIAAAVATELFGDQSSVVLKELNNKVIYVAESETDGKFLGLFKMKIRQEAEIDSDTGEVTSIKKKGWSKFFVISRGANQTFIGNKTTICHIPSGNLSAAQTIVIGTPAVKAHLKHGDYIGTCNSTIPSPMNNTNSTIISNQTTQPPIQNTTNVTIPPTNQTTSPMNTTNSSVISNQTA